MKREPHITLGKPPLAMVILRHTLDDGTHHLDWMLAAESTGQLPLITFRTAQSLDRLVPGETAELKRIADHRPIYLNFEGPLSNGRGGVQRVSRGEIIGFHTFEGGFRLELRWETGAGGVRGMLVQQVELQHQDSSRWQLRCVGLTGG